MTENLIFLGYIVMIVISFSMAVTQKTKLAKTIWVVGVVIWTFSAIIWTQV